jgi:NCS2 family nucleobase:cation symporter-2
MAKPPRKPANLLYGVNDRPPFPVAFALGVQHVFILFISLIFPALIVNMLGDSIDAQTARSFVSLSMIAAGISTILQALRFRSFGSGYLCPAVCGPSYFAASASAAALGGLPLVFGMTAFAGAIEAALSRVMNKLRALFPPEVMGLVVALVGIVIIPLAINNFFGINGPDTVSTGTEVSVGIITLATMIGINVWARGKMRLYSIIIGMAVGYLTSFFLGIMPQASLERIGAAEWFSFPYIRDMRWSFDISMAVPFIVATICSTFKTVGDLGTCQKINDADWRRADMQNVSSGILVDGLGGVIPGLIGAFGQSTSSSNVGLSLATGATSRVIAYVTGGIIIVLAFFPRLSELFIIMPPPVMGATLIFSISFMIIAGLQIIMTRMLDLRRTFVLGLGLIFGLSADLAPQLYSSVHPWIKPVFSSSLALGSCTVIVMNLIMRIGISNRSHTELYPGKQSSEDVFDFVEKQGSSWGARPEVVANAASALNEVLESVTAMGLAQGPLQVDIKFDELNLDVDVSWTGGPLQFTNKMPTPEELLENDESVGMISSFLISRAADKLSTSSKDGISHVLLHFEH